MAKKRKKKTSVAGIILTVFGALFFAAAAGLVGLGIHQFRMYQSELAHIESMRRVVDKSVYYDGVVVDGMDVGGKTYDEVVSILNEKHAQDIENMVLHVKCNDKTYTLQADAFYNTEYVAQQAYLVGREGTLEERYQVVQALKDEPQSFEVNHVVSTPELDLLVEQIYQDAYTPIENAKVTGFDKESHEATFQKEVNGTELNRSGLKKAMEKAVADEDFGKEIKGEVLSVPAEVTAESLKASFTKLASFTTTTTSSKARNTNIRLATASFNGRMVEPGETFSFNASTGQRTPAKGYQEAGVINNGKLIQEAGGGVCQVSTTLFNAVARAGMKIVTRHSHSWPSSYVKTGFDAAVNWPSTDFAFRNVSEYPIYLIGYMTPHGSEYKLTVEVYGIPVLDEGVHIDLRYEQKSRTSYTTEYIVDKSLDPGDKVKERDGHDNIRGTTYIRYMKGDELIKEEVLFENNYRMITARYRIGPKSSSSDSESSHHSSDSDE